jgi:hypothetical protein
MVVVADDIQVDHQTGSFVGAALEKFANACGHRDPLPSFPWRRSRLR